MTRNTVFILGGAGFIGHHMGRALRKQGKYVVVFDIKAYCEHTDAIDYFDEYYCMDLSLRETPSKNDSSIFYDRDSKPLTHSNEFKYTLQYLPRRDDKSFEQLLDYYKPTEIYNFACVMGGAGFIFTKLNDSKIILDSALINLNLVQALKNTDMIDKVKVFYSSSACMYPAYNQEDPSNPKCSEDSAWPAQPDSAYGLEKLFSEQVYMIHNRLDKLNVRIARFHNIFGPEGTWEGGKEKAPAALCRKVAQAKDGDTIEIWGPGTQTRSFLDIEECIRGIQKLMASDFTGPVNIGSDEMITINDLAKMIIGISGKNLKIKNIDGPVGVMGRNSDNRLIQEKLGWRPTQPLIEGITKLYKWINNQTAQIIHECNTAKCS